MIAAGDFGPRLACALRFSQCPIVCDDEPGRVRARDAGGDAILAVDRDQPRACVIDSDGALLALHAPVVGLA